MKKFINKILDIYNKVLAFIASIPHDKLLHFMVCATICMTIAKVTGKVWIGLVVAIVLGFLKEWKDSTEPKDKFDWQDVIYDVSGSLYGALFMYQF